MNFQNEEYKGCVLRIPEFMLKSNEDLKIALEEFTKVYLKNKISVFLPDNERNLYELQHWEEKALAIKQKKEFNKKEKERLDRYYEDLINFKKIKVIEINSRYYSKEDNEIIIKGERIETLTNKLNLLNENGIILYKTLL